MSERDFDMKVLIPTLKRVVQDYGIRYDADRPVPDDDQAADGLFEAAVAFLSRVGVYCLGTNRTIGVTEKEIRQLRGGDGRGRRPDDSG